MEKINRRQFISQFGLATAAMCVSPRFAFAKPLASDKKIRLGVVGGNFGLGFFFHEHPNCIVEAVSDLDTQRRNKLMEVYQCKKSYESLEKLLRDPKVEAVALFTPAPDHVRHTIQCLEAGKHVLCAVPAAMNEEECHQLFEAVKRSGLTYMMAETTTYREETMMAQEFYRSRQVRKHLQQCGPVLSSRPGNLVFRRQQETDLAAWPSTDAIPYACYLFPDRRHRRKTRKRSLQRLGRWKPAFEQQPLW